MKEKWLIPVLLFVVLVIGYMIRGFVQTRITVEMLQTDKIEEVSSVVGVLIKDEHVRALSVENATDISAKNGQRVAKGEIIATVYSGMAEEDIKIKLADINKRIAAIESSRSGDAVYISDATKIEGEIASGVDEVIALMAERDMESLSEYKYRLITMTDQKAVAKGEKESFSSDLTELRAQKSVLEAQLGKIEVVATADSPGLFIEGKDGFEQKLTPESSISLVPNQIEGIIAHEKNDKIEPQEEGTYTFKIINNYTYSVAMNLEDSFCETLKVDDNVAVRFSDFSLNSIPAKITHISEKNESGLRAVVVQCNMHVEGLLSKRVVNVDFVKKSVSGYKVATEHLHTVDNAVGLFIKRGAVMKFIPVTVVYSTEEEAIVSQASAATPIKPYDEVVTAAPEYEDGKVIVSQ